MISVALVDDNPIVRMGLRQLLEISDDFEVAGEADTAAGAVALVEAEHPDVVLLDVRMPGGSGLDVVSDLARQSVVLMLTQTDDSASVKQALRDGALGYLVYGEFAADGLASTLRAAAAGESVLSPTARRALLAGLGDSPATPPPASPGPRTPAASGLSAREGEIMGLVAQGKSNPEIAAELFLSVKTVKNHLNRIFPKLGVATRAQAIAHWHGGGPLDPS